MVQTGSPPEQRPWPGACVELLDAWSPRAAAVARSPPAQRATARAGAAEEKGRIDCARRPATSRRPGDRRPAAIPPGYALTVAGRQRRLPAATAAGTAVIRV